VPVRLAVTGCSPRPELEIRRFPPPWSRCGDGDRTNRTLRAADACRLYSLAAWHGELVISSKLDTIEWCLLAFAMV
jgi:hypothetical protein